mgnify:CR=1 FL=1
MSCLVLVISFLVILFFNHKINLVMDAVQQLNVKVDGLETALVQEQAQVRQLVSQKDDTIKGLKEVVEEPTEEV